MVLIKYMVTNITLKVVNSFTFQYGSNQIFIYRDNVKSIAKFTFQYGSNQIKQPASVISLLS